MFNECDQSYLKKDNKAKITQKKNNGKIEILFQFFLGKPTLELETKIPCFPKIEQKNSYF